MREPLPEFVSGMLMTCPAAALSNYPEWGACAKEVRVSREDYAKGKKGYCEKHKHLESIV